MLNAVNNFKNNIKQLKATPKRNRVYLVAKSYPSMKQFKEGIFKTSKSILEFD